jgi:hypothetical protein
MLGIWFGAGIFLDWHNPDNFISDWISSAAAIGTVGAVITSLYLANKKISRDEYISIAHVTLAVWADNKYIKFESLVLNNMNFKITVRSIRVQIDQYILFLTESEVPICSESKITTRIIPANKTTRLSAEKLFWLDDNFQPISEDLPYNLTSYLIDNQKTKIKLYIDSDVYSYEIQLKSFKKSIEPLGYLGSYTKIEFDV